LRSAGARRAQHEEEPQEEPAVERDLPHAPEVDVLVPLVAEPEGDPGLEHALDREPLAGQRAGDDEQQGAEEHVDPEALEARLAPADDGREEEPVARKAVAIQKTAVCRCHVRAMA
jgi:hypothetical protein